MNTNFISILITLILLIHYVECILNGRIDREHDGIIHVKDLVLFFGESIPVRNNKFNNKFNNNISTPIITFSISLSLFHYHINNTIL